MIRYIIVIMLLTGGAIGQILTKEGFQFQTPPEMLGGTLLGNGIVDILAHDSLVWIGTGYGLNRTVNAGIGWENFTSRDYHGKGKNSPRCRPAPG